MSLSNLIKDLSFYGLIDSIQRLFGFLFIPYYTIKLTQVEYGNFDLFVVISSALYVIVDLQLISGFNRLYHEYESSKAKKELIGSILIIRFFIGIIVSFIILLLLYHGSLETSYLPPFKSNVSEWILIVFFPISTSIFDSVIALSRMSRSKKSFGVITGVTLVVTYASALFFLECTNFKVSGLLAAMLFGKLFGGIGGLLLLIDQISFKFNYSIAKNLMKYCLPLIPGWWITFVAVYISRFLVYGQNGAEFNALLSILMKSLLLVNIVTLAFRTAWYPLAMAVYAEKKSQKFFISANRIFLTSLFMVLLVGTASVDFVVHNFLPNTYSEVAIHFPMFLLGTVLAAAEDNFQLGLSLSKNTKLITIGSFIYSFTSIFILICFVEEYGLTAVGYSLLISASVRLLYTYIVSQRSYYIPYDKRAAFTFMIFSLLIFLYNYALSTEYENKYMLKLIVIICGIVLLPFLVARSDFESLSNRVKNSRLNRND